MYNNTFGNIFRLTSFGESHGKAIGGVIDGFPAGITIDMEFIQKELNRRRPGQSAITTARKEADEVEFLSGIYEGVSTGCPIGFAVWNTNQHSNDYDNMKDVYRPSHADYTYTQKYGIRDHRGVSIVGDAAYVLQAMLPQIKEAKHPDWMKMIHEWQAQDYHPVSDPTHLMPHQVIGEVCNQCGPEAVYVTDVGQHQMWAAQYLRHAKSRGFITSGGLGTMGFGYGAAIGAQMALGRDQRVVMFTGDGSFHMNLNEACTAVSYDLPIITVIFNNSVLGMVRQWQTTFYGKRYSQTDPHRHTDFVKLAEGFGLKGYRCTNLPEFQQAFAEALRRKGPTWIECIIDKDEKVLPMIPGGGDINDIIME